MRSFTTLGKNRSSTSSFSPVATPRSRPRTLGAVLAAAAMLLTGGCAAEGDAGGGTEGNGGDTGASAAGGSAAEWREGFPTFTRHVVDDFESGYQAIALDVDRDGRQDVAALSTGGSQLVWYRNPDWERYTITTGTERYINMAAHDVDGDGDLDLAVASEFSLGNSLEGGTVYWAEAPDDPIADQEWPLHPIDAVPTSHRIRWADIDGDGRPELLNLPIIGVGAERPAYEGAVDFKAYSIPDDPTGDWDARVLDDSRLEVAHGLAVVDWDGDATDDVLTASLGGVHLYRPALDDEAERVLHVGAGNDGARPNGGSSEVGIGRLGGEGRFIATNEPWHGNEIVVYRPDASGALPWSREVIETDFQAGHALVTVDLNGDGYDEIVAGHRGGDHNLFVYRYRPEPGTWEPIPLDLGGVAVSSLDVGDLNGDGHPDVLALGSATDNIVWYENSGTP